MTAYDDGLLAAQFAALAPEPLEGRWDDVLREATGARENRRQLKQSASQGSRRPLVVLATVLFVVVLGAASALAVRAVLLPDGPTALPPRAAPPSAPASGTLILHYDGRPGLVFPNRFVPVNQVWVYADGRVLWRREDGPFGVADSVGEIRTGILERRLTPQGAELLRSRLTSTHLFDHDLSLQSDFATTGLTWGRIDVRKGNRLVSLEWCCWPGSSEWFLHNATPATRKQSRVIGRLTKLLSDPASRLPAGAWEDRQFRAYVPSKYAICFGRGLRAPAQSLEPRDVMRALPGEAQKLLRGKTKTYRPTELGVGPRWTRNRAVECSEVTTPQALALDTILRRAGFDPKPRSPSRPQPAGNVRFRAPAPDATFISFEPILPHGQWERMGG